MATQYCEWQWTNEAAGRARCRHCAAEMKIKSLATVRTCRAPGAPGRPAAVSLDCVHRGDTVRTVPCKTCRDTVIDLPIYACALHGECTKENHRARHPDLAEIQVCRGCSDLSVVHGPLPVAGGQLPVVSGPLPRTTDHGPRTNPKGPGLIAKAANYSRAVARDLKNGRKRRSPELIRRIFEQHCRTCARYNPETGECAECGCPVNADPEANKIAWASEHCPLKKWPIQTANLMYYILPLKHQDKVWQWHVEQLRRRLDIFNGRRIITIATPGAGERLALDDAQQVIDAFGTDAKSIEFVLRENDPHHWETPAFRAMLKMIADGSVVGSPLSVATDHGPGATDSQATFYGHAKGVRRAIQDAVRPWCEKMYHHNLDRWAEVREILTAWPCCGIARVGASPLAIGGKTRCRWHYSGTYFWFRNDALFRQLSVARGPLSVATDNGQRTTDPFAIHDHSHAVEAYLGTQFAIDEAYCLAYQDAGDVYSAATWCDKTIEARSTATIAEGELESVGDMSALPRLLNRLIIEPRVKLDCRIVTAADAGFFVPLQLLVSSVLLSHDCPLSVIDLGLTPALRDWLTEQGVETLPRPPLVYPRGDANWQNWNKPEYLRMFAGREPTRLLWIDADAIVTGSLEWLDALARDRPALTPCYAARLFWGDGKDEACLANDPAIYERFPVHKRMAECWPNNGVFGCDTVRDAVLLAEWSAMCAAAGRDKSLRKPIKFFDQGALQWALEATGQTQVLVHDKRWNWPDIQGAASLETLADRLAEAPEARILHFAGDRKPYSGFHADALPIDLRSGPGRLTLFVVSHLREDLAAIADAPHVAKVFLPDLDPDNDLAESRIFLESCRLLDDSSSEFIGVCAPSWNNKYREIARPIAGLHRLVYAPATVYAGCRGQADWPDESERQHPGMGAVIDELAAYCGLRPADVRRPSVWNNNFVCHRDVMRDFVRFWRDLYRFSRDRWPTIPFDNSIHDASDRRRGFPPRQYAYLAERFALIYFATRTDLTIEQVPR